MEKTIVCIVSYLFFTSNLMFYVKKRVLRFHSTLTVKILLVSFILFLPGG